LAFCGIEDCASVSLEKPTPLKWPGIEFGEVKRKTFFEKMISLAQL
jgi:hypothetical protein